MPKKYQPTIKEARDLYWSAVAEWDETRWDPYATWTMMGVAADNVKAAQRVWIGAVSRSLSTEMGLGERRRAAAQQIMATLSETLRNGR